MTQRPNRTRKYIPVTLTPEELATLDAFAASLGVPRHAAMLAAIRRAPTLLRSIDDLTEDERRRARPRKA